MLGASAMKRRITSCVLFGCIVAPLSSCGTKSDGDRSASALRGPQAGTPAAATAALCTTVGLRTAQGYGTVSGATGAFSTDIGSLRHWMDTRSGSSAPGAATSQYSGYPTSSATAVCYFDGTFAVAKGPPGQTPPTYSRIDVVVAPDGLPYLDVAGTPDNLPISDPNQ